jgi:pimeloyl-ACP methyl ester carboxylesterase
MNQAKQTMNTITNKDGVQIFYKDWGQGQPIVFHHGWPLSSDDWDAQMLFFLQQGYRVVGIDRRGHGRSSQMSGGHDMDYYAADAAAVVDHLNLRDAIHVGHYWRRRGRALCRAARQGPRCQGGADVCGATAHAEDAEKPGWDANRGI